MTTVTFTIPDDKISRVIAAMKYFYPIPLDENGDPQFTDSQWAKESLRRYIINQTHRYELKVARDAASAVKDDTLVS